MAGARVVPLFADMTIGELDLIFPQLNGILIPGGNTPVADPNNNASFSNYT